MTPAYGFQRALKVELQPDGSWRLLEDLRYLSALTQKAYTIERGFQTDFASVPRLPVAYWLTGNTAHLAATVHDYLYQTGLEPRAIADAIFAEIMDRSKMPGWRRVLMWMGVRIFAEAHYQGGKTLPAAGFELEPAGD